MISSRTSVTLVLVHVAYNAVRVALLLLPTSSLHTGKRRQFPRQQGYLGEAGARERTEEIHEARHALRAGH